MSDQEEARIAASRHLDDLYSRWLVRPSPGNRFLNDRNGSIRDIRDGRTPQSSTIHQPSGSADCANSTPVKSIPRVARFSLDVLCRNAFVL